MITYKNYQRIFVTENTISFEVSCNGNVGFAIKEAACQVYSGKAKFFNIITHDKETFIRFSYDIEKVVAMDKDTVTFYE